MLLQTLQPNDELQSKSIKISKHFFENSRPRSKFAQWQRVGDVGQVFITNGSRIYEVSLDIIDMFDKAAEIGDQAVDQLLTKLKLNANDFIDNDPIKSPPLQAISLAIAQKCNFGCAYCYADQGVFGGTAKNMSFETAQKSIDLLYEKARSGTRVNIAFLGGEPLINRPILIKATEYAVKLSAIRNITPSFSITTNGSLLTEDDALFFEQYGFALTVSLDGIGKDHDRQRPFKNGNASFNKIITNIRPLLKVQRKMQVSVRSTITSENLKLKDSVDYFLNLGFHSVGFSPLLRSPNGRGEMKAENLTEMLEAMIECGLEFERRVAIGERYAFNNITNAIKELHNSTHRPYPCGAGASYLGISADGDLAACHRFVGDMDGKMGSLMNGIDAELQNNWLKERHVHNQSPCNTCWARYLCAGGCHHEVIARGRPACDYIRGWLLYCLQAYSRLMKTVPNYFKTKEQS